MRAVLLLAVCGLLGFVWAEGPRVLVVQAHPDDENNFAGSLYKTSHDLLGVVDSVVITDGQGGYDCSELASWIYHEEITNPEIARKVLPQIRKGEMLRSAKVLNMNDVHFLGEPDVAYTLNVTEVLDSWWDVPLVQYQLQLLLTRGLYDYVFVLLPDPTQHGEHQAASLLALDAVKNLPKEIAKPIVLGGGDLLEYHGCPGYPIANAPEQPSFTFDRTQPIGNDTNYMVIAEWSIAEHKTQGCLQLDLTGDAQQTEYYWYFDMNPSSQFQQTMDYFTSLATAPYRPFHRCF